jgi:PAS domain S-box-containing protein
VTLASIGVAVIATDMGGEINFINPVAVRLTGWTVEEAVGRQAHDIFKVIDEQKQELVGDIIERVLVENDIVATANNTSLVTRTGERIPIENTAAPISDSTGRVAGVVFVFHDVTAKRRAQAALFAAHELTVAQHNRLKAVFETLPVGAALIDAHGGQVECNAAFDEAWGRPRPVTRSVEDYAAYKAWWVGNGQQLQPNEWAAARAVLEGESALW